MDWDMDWDIERIKLRWEIQSQDMKAAAREIEKAIERIEGTKDEKGEDNPQDGKPQSIDEYLERKKERQPFYKNADPNKKPWE